MLNKVRDGFGFGGFDQPLTAGHGHSHGNEGDHGHTHGVIDPTIASTERGVWAVKWSFVILAVTAAIQFAVVLVSGSVALLANANMSESLSAAFGSYSCGLRRLSTAMLHYNENAEHSRHVPWRALLELGQITLVPE